MRQSKLKHSTGLKPRFPSVCFWSQKYKNSVEKNYHVCDAGKLLRNPFGLGNDHLSPPSASGCLSISEGHSALSQGLSHGQPQLLAGGGKLKRENLKPRSSAIAQAFGSWKSSMTRGMTATSALVWWLISPPYSYLCPATAQASELAQVLLYFQSCDYLKFGAWVHMQLLLFSKNLAWQQLQQVAIKPPLTGLESASLQREFQTSYLCL